MQPKTRQHAIRVIISEVIMVFAVIVTVIVLALIVSGYWLGEGLRVERNGMLQISSMPTGATVTVDGSEWGWLDRTNASKVVSSGEHTVSLTKDGYDSWSRTINVTEGLLYRIHYPRLFPLERTATSVYNVADYNYATISPNGKLMLLANDTTEWLLLNLESDTLDPKNIDISTIFSFVDLADATSVTTGATDAATSATDAAASASAAASALGTFAGTITSAHWSQDSNHVLLTATNGDTTERVLLRPRDLKNSVNITKQFGDFSKLEILDNSATSLLAIKGGNLYLLDLSDKKLSNILVKDIISFDHYDSEVVFVAKTPDSSTSTQSASEVQTIEPRPTDTLSFSETSESSSVGAPHAHPYYVGALRLGDNKITELLPLDSSAQVTISKFYDDKYLTLLSDQTVTLYKKEDLSEVLSGKLSFAPSKIAVGHDGEFIEMTSLVTVGSSASDEVSTDNASATDASNADGASATSSSVQFATLDMEAQSVREWTIDSANYGWLDHDMLYSVANGELIVYDFDGLNRRVLVSTVSPHFPVVITSDKWLYYFSNGRLFRENIR